MSDNAELIADLEGEAAHWVLEKDGQEVARLMIAAVARIAEIDATLAEAANVIDAARLVIKNRDQSPHEMQVMHACQIILERIRARPAP